MKKIASTVFTLALTAILVSSNVFAAGENFVTDQTWAKLLNKGDVTKKTENGQDYWAAEGVNSAWESPGINILPAIKKALGEEDSVALTVSFEMRATFNNSADATEFDVGVLVRAYNEDGYTVDDFKNDYEGTFIKNSSDVNLTGRFSNEETVNGSEWTKFSYDIEELTQEDVNFEHFASWVLCVDRISSDVLGKIKTLDFKNVSVTVDGGETEEPNENKDDVPTAEKPSAVEKTPMPTAKAGKPTPTPVSISTPVNFDKYPQTLVDGTVYTAGDATAKPDATADAAPTEENKTGRTAIYIIIGVAAAVIILGAAVAVIVIKKKKSADGEVK